MRGDKRRNGDGESKVVICGGKGGVGKNRNCGYIYIYTSTYIGMVSTSKEKKG